MRHIQELSPRETYAAYMMDTVIVDLREPQDVAGKAIDVKRFINLPYSQLDQRFNELPEDRQVVFLSRIGNKGKDAARFMMEHGYENVAAVEGGLTAWEEEGLPVR